MVQLRVEWGRYGRAGSGSDVLKSERKYTRVAIYKK